jgi:PhnB protein
MCVHRYGTCHVDGGNCEQAFRFYEEHLGAVITGIVRHGEQPSPNVPAD